MIESLQLSISQSKPIIEREGLRKAKLLRSFMSLSRIKIEKRKGQDPHLENKGKAARPHHNPPLDDPKNATQRPTKEHENLQHTVPSI
jgi:hypothetical protein